jgi:hypothetical protein
MSATVPLSLPLPEEPPLLEALDAPSSPDSGGGAPGVRALDVSEVVVEDLTTVELVDSARVVVVVLLVTLTVVVVVALDVAFVLDDDPEVPVLEEAAVTSMTPAMPCDLWILQ